MNKSSSPLLHLYLHLLHFLKMNKSSYFKKKKKKRNKKRRKLSKKALGLGALGSYFLGFFQKKKKKFKIFNSLKKFEISKFFKKKNHQSKISILWKNSRFPKFSKKKKRTIRKFSKKALGLGAFGSYFLGCLKKKNSSINFFSKIQDFQIFQKKNSKFSIPSKNSSFRNSKKKKSSLNSSSGTESYDPLPHSLVMQHQVNCPPTAFIEAWSMSQTRGICQVCWILFNE